MTRIRGTFTAALFLLVGCGSEGGGSNEDTDPSTAEDAGGGGGEMTSCITELEVVDLAPDAPPTYTCDANPSATYGDSPNACRNDADCTLIATDKVRRLAKECALSCRGAGDCAAAATCNEGCLADATRNQLGGVLTEDCSACYAQVALCALEKCYAECADDPDSLDCVACSFKQGCRVPFERCSGLDRKN